MRKQSNLSVAKLAHSLAEVADMLGVSKGHIRNESARGKLHLLKSGRRTLIMAVEVQRYLSELSECKTTEN